MIRLKGNVVKLASAVCLFGGVTSEVQAQERTQLLQEFVNSNISSKAVIDILSKSTGNSPERGAVALDTFAGTKVSKKFKFPFNRYLSILVTDADTTSSISFSEVMKQLAEGSGDPSFTKEILFDQWWDTANKKPGLALGSHCDDLPPTDSLNNFPYRCPRDLEGKQATNAAVFTDEPNGDNAYSAIAVVNRYDLLSSPKTTANGKVIYPDCGEYRIIFARNSGKTVPPDAAPAPGVKPKKVGNKFQRNLIAFEARIKNPDPTPQNATNQVPAGCLPILNFWYSLSDPALSGTVRGARLHDFFMKGKMTVTGGSLGSLRWPVVDVRNYSFDAGQIRTNQFINNVTFVPGRPPTYSSPGKPPETNVNPNDWMLREFRAFVFNHTVRIDPDSDKSTPGTNLFKFPAPVPNDARLPMLVTAMHDQIADVLGGEKSGKFANVDDINAIKFFTLKQGANAFESDESIQAEGDILNGYNNPNLSQDIQNDLNGINYSGPAMKPENVIDRVRTQTCAGCHQFSDTVKTVPAGTFGFDKPGGLGGKALWPTKACGDVDGTCTLPDDAVLLVKSPPQHPPMQFTQVSELILTPSIADGGKRWRYSISTTVECMLDFREKFMDVALGLPVTNADNCPH